MLFVIAIVRLQHDNLLDCNVKVFPYRSRNTYLVSFFKLESPFDFEGLMEGIPNDGNILQSIPAVSDTFSKFEGDKYFTWHVVELYKILLLYFRVK